MALPEFTMRQLLEAGVHFGHQKHRWNPRMGNYIFGDRSGIHILDLAQTVPLLHQALVTIRDTVAGGGRVLFVGTKRQAAQPLADAATNCAQYYMNHRWLGGTLTNWKTVANSITRLRQLDEQLGGEVQGLTKKEMLQLTRERDKLDRALGGIKDMGGTPDLLVIIDTNKEAIAIKEANKLSIPVIAILDSNSNPAGISHPIPGNDDAARAIALYCDLFSRAVIEGISVSQGAAGIDVGEAEEPLVQELPAEVAPAAAAEAPAAEAPAAEAPAADAPAAEAASEEQPAT
jgi:small subunit ribosomal protein S2